MHRYSMVTVKSQPEDEEPPQVRIRRMALPIFIILIGMGVLLYPVIATQWNNIQQQKVADDYSQFVQEQPEEMRNEIFDAALRYNTEQQGSPILDPWLADVTEDNPQYQEYMQHLKTNGAMAQIVVPKAKVKLPVYHGSDEKVLEKGVGHLFGTSLPVGGESTHAVLTGHTGLANATLFDNLTDVREGDAIYLYVFGKSLKYEVDQLEVVLPHEVEHLAVIEGQDLVTLITCTPYGINSHRLLVRGHRVPLDPGEEAIAEGQRGLIWQWWMLAALVVCALVFVLIVVWIWRLIRQNRAAQRNTTIQGSVIAVLLFTTLLYSYGGIPTAKADEKTVVGNISLLDPSTIESSQTVEIALVKNTTIGKTSQPIPDAYFTAKRIAGIDLTTSAGWELAEQYTVAQAEYAETDYTAAAITNEYGEATLTGLPIGLYFIKEQDSGSQRYGKVTATPFLITLPTGNITGTKWEYATRISLKTMRDGTTDKLTSTLTKEPAVVPTHKTPNGQASGNTGDRDVAAGVLAETGANVWGLATLVMGCVILGIALRSGIAHWVSHVWRR